MNTAETEVFVELIRKFNKTEQREIVSVVEDEISTATEKQTR